MQVNLLIILLQVALSMFKTGICKLEDLDFDKTVFLKQLKNVSITLYEKACGLKNADEVTERILLLRSDERGAYKRTYAKRFEKFDAEVVSLIERTFTGNNLNIHDVSVSDGRTAVDFYHKLISYQALNYAASDYEPKVKLLTSGKLKVILTPDNKILELTYSPFVFSIPKRDIYWLYPINHLIRKLIMHFKVKPLLNDYLNGNVEAKDIFLFAPVAMNLAENNKNFSLTEHNILNPMNKTDFDVIRAMNVLNLSYFTDLEFSKIVKNIYQALKVGGLFVTGSNQEADTVVNGGVYKKTSTGFECIWQSGSGSCVNHKIVKPQ